MTSDLGRDIASEGYDILLKAFTSETLTFEGKYHSFQDVPIEIGTRQKPRPAIWYGVITPETAAWAAHQGFDIITGGPTDESASIARTYAQTCAEVGDQRTGKGGHRTQNRRRSD